MENNYLYDKEKKTSGIKDRIFNIIIAVLSVILAVMVVITFARFTEDAHYDYTASPNDLIRSIKNGYYSDAVNDMYTNIALGKTIDTDSGYSTPYALSDYFEFASSYYAYTNAASLAGNSGRSSDIKERAESFKKKMDISRNKAGELDFIVNEIDALFDK